MSDKKFTVLVFNKLPEQEAITAFHTLTNYMGYGGKLRALNRTKYFNVVIKAVENAEERLSEIIRRTTLFLNPNKELFRILDDDLNSLFVCPDDVVNKFILIRNKDAGQDLADLLKKWWDYEEVISIEEYVLWNLQIDRSCEGVDELVEEIAVLKSRESGLLANPHSQEYMVLK